MRKKYTAIKNHGFHTQETSIRLRESPTWIYEDGGKPPGAQIMKEEHATNKIMEVKQLLSFPV